MRKKTTQVPEMFSSFKKLLNSKVLHEHNVTDVLRPIGIQNYLTVLILFLRGVTLL